VPGHTAYEAVQEFLAPLEEAIAVLDGFSKLVVLGKQGAYRKNEVYSWSLNGDLGMKLTGVGIFRADMHFEIIDADPAKYGKPFRVTARGYRYSLEDKPGRDQERGEVRWMMHWHPNGRSTVDYPHLHMRPDLGPHQPTSRLTFEKAIEWCIATDAPLTCETDEAMQIVLLTETNHRLNRTWNERPGEPVG
jgi:hypothetical protein